MKTKNNWLYLLLAALLVLLVACGGAEEPAEEPALTVIQAATPIPPSPEELAHQWVIGENEKLDETLADFFTNPAYSIGHNTNVACGYPSVEEGVLLDSRLFNNDYPNGVYVPCDVYINWVAEQLGINLADEATKTVTEDSEAENATPAEEENNEVNDSCPQDADMVESALAAGYVHFTFDGEQVVWDPCKWHGYTEDGLTLENEKWQATVVFHTGEEKSDPVVWRGPAEIPGNVSFTLRYTGEGAGYGPEHWVHDDCQLMIQEFAFGLRREEWDYGTFEGNVSCPALNTLLEGKYDVNDLPNTYVIAAIFGGESTMWGQKDWEGGAHVFNAGQHADGSLNFIKLEIPSWADSCHIDYWNGETGAPDQLMPGDPGISLNEASLHCHSD